MIKESAFDHIEYVKVLYCNFFSKFVNLKIQKFPVTGYRDIIALSYTLPYILTPPQKVDVMHSLRVTTGSSAAPIVSKDFTSAIYLSQDPEFDWNDMALGNVPNNIGVYKHYL